MSGNGKSGIIKIGSKDYEIIYKERVEDWEGNQTWGLVDYEKCEISIDNSICEQLQFTILIHEITHAVLDEMGSLLSEDDQFVSALSNMLSQIIIDNKGLYE